MPFRTNPIFPAIPFLFLISYFNLFHSRPHAYSLLPRSQFFRSAWANIFFLSLFFFRCLELPPTSLIVFCSVVGNLSFRFLADCLSQPLFFFHLWLHIVLISIFESHDPAGKVLIRLHRVTLLVFAVFF